MALPKSHFNFIFKWHSFTCVGVDMHMLWHVCVWGGWACQRTACWSRLSPSTMLAPGSDSGCQAWQWEPLTSESSHQLIFIFFLFSPLWVCALSVCSCVCKYVCLYRFTHIWWVCCTYICLCVGVGTNTCVCACILSLLSSYFLSLWDSVSPLPKAHI